MGGLLSIQVARTADIESIPEPVNGIVYGTIVFKPEKGFVTWLVTDESANADSDNRASREGSVKLNRLPFSIPKGNAAMRDMLEQASDDEFIILYKDANGKQWLFGLLYAPVEFEYSYNSGTARADKNAYTCRFFYDGPDNYFEYNGALAIAPAGPAPAIVIVNGEVIATLSPGETLSLDSDFDFTFQVLVP